MFIRGPNVLETKVDPFVCLIHHDLDHYQSRSRSPQTDAPKLKNIFTILYEYNKVVTVDL